MSTITKKLNKELNKKIARVIESSNGIIAYHQEEQKGLNYTHAFRFTAEPIYKANKALEYYKSLTGPDVDDPIAYLGNKVKDLTTEYLNYPEPRTEGSAMGLITETWDRSVLQRMITLLNEWIGELTLVSQGKVANDIPVNFWDDYEDGGKTYAYIEDSEIPKVYQRQALRTLFDIISATDFDEKVNGSLELDVLNLTRPQITLRGFTHDNLEKLVEGLKNIKMAHDGIPFRIYSES